MANLKEETLYKLNSCGKTPDDIVWIGCPLFEIDKDEFWELADVEYDSGYGGQEVATDLLIVGKNWWLERHEYDGAEWWEYKQLPVQPFEEEHIERLTIRGSHCIALATLGEINDPEEPEQED